MDKPITKKVSARLVPASKDHPEFIDHESPDTLRNRALDAISVTQWVPPSGQNRITGMIDSKPDAIFSSLFAGDLSKFVREGELRGLFKDRPVFNLLGGEPEYLDPLKEEAPPGWYVTGYPWSAIATPEHKRFLDAYQAKYKDYPRQGSVVGYSVVMSAAAAIRKARSTDTAKLVAALEGLNVETPFGKITYRALDHQSTMGAYVGRIAVKDGKGVMIDWRYADGASYLPADDWVRAHRPAN